MAGVWTAISTELQKVFWLVPLLLVCLENRGNQHLLSQMKAQVTRPS